MSEVEQLRADVAFLLLRAESAGSCSFSPHRWTGMSSNALVSVAYGGEQAALPSDRSDFMACALTMRRLPRHRRTPAVIAAFARARDHYLERYPDDRFPETRRAKRAEWEAEGQKWDKSRRKRRRA